MVARESSSIPVTELRPTLAEDVSTTNGAMRPGDRTVEGSVTRDMGTTEGRASLF